MDTIISIISLYQGALVKIHINLGNHLFVAPDEKIISFWAHTK